MPKNNFVAKYVPKKYKKREGGKDLIKIVSQTKDSILVNVNLKYKWVCYHCYTAVSELSGIVPGLAFLLCPAPLTKPVSMLISLVSLCLSRVTVSKGLNVPESVRVGLPTLVWSLWVVSPVNSACVWVSFVWGGGWRPAGADHEESDQCEGECS